MRALNKINALVKEAKSSPLPLLEVFDLEEGPYLIMLVH